MSGETHYLVEWQCDIWAESKEDAARQALELLRDPSGSATLFKVRSNVHVSDYWRYSHLTDAEPDVETTD